MAINAFAADAANVELCTSCTLRIQIGRNSTGSVPNPTDQLISGPFINAALGVVLLMSTGSVAGADQRGAPR
jgi:hypothetical protein